MKLTVPDLAVTVPFLGYAAVIAAVHLSMGSAWGPLPEPLRGALTVLVLASPLVLVLGVAGAAARRFPNESLVWAGVAYTVLGLAARVVGHEIYEDSSGQAPLAAHLVPLLAWVAVGAGVLWRLGPRGWRRCGLFALGASGACALFPFFAWWGPARVSTMFAWIGPGAGVLLAAISWHYLEGTDRDRRVAVPPG